MHFSGKHLINCLNTLKLVKAGCRLRKFTSCPDWEMNLTSINCYHLRDNAVWIRAQHWYFQCSINWMMVWLAVTQATICIQRNRTILSLNTMWINLKIKAVTNFEKMHQICTDSNKNHFQKFKFGRILNYLIITLVHKHKNHLLNQSFNDTKKWQKTLSIARSVAFLVLKCWIEL